jgi:hypothetical protein
MQRSSARRAAFASNRSVTDAELLGAYAASDAVWCLYPPFGDHASGVLGRAAQLGIPVCRALRVRWRIAFASSRTSRMWRQRRMVWPSGSPVRCPRATKPAGASPPAASPARARQRCAHGPRPCGPGRI